MSNFRAYLERQQPLVVTECLPIESGRSGGLFVTIPCYDEPELLESLQSLASCTPPTSPVTVIAVVNSSDHSSPEVLSRNSQTIETISTWWSQNTHPFFRLRLLHVPALPSKWAGVGWARKIAMDEAIRCLDNSGEEDGILVAFDADSFVSDNYFTAIESVFARNQRFNFVTLNFKHPVDDPALTPSMREGIILYELYLRYLRNAMKWSGYPHAIHTVGSSFAVRASAYVKQGGMNRRQAGEDFHFLHKMVLLGDYGLIHEATVFPAARISHRVPFGTGAALKRWEEGDQELYAAYSLQIFETLKPLFKSPGLFYNASEDVWTNLIGELDPRLQNYWTVTVTGKKLLELKNNCGDIKSFEKRFFHIVNAFWIIQYLNLCESTEGGKGKLQEEALLLLKELGINVPTELSARQLLEIYREIDNGKLTVDN
jgi:hypothetical protein